MYFQEIGGVDQIQLRPGLNLALRMPAYIAVLDIRHCEVPKGRGNLFVIARSAYILVIARPKGPWQSVRHCEARRAVAISFSIESI